ncbi:leukocyte elastase inhibitor-like protein [Lates japonicus]|uniref:Leukocyte elastase inhibitor-like protein n=1 Tax=Lates japonicus TaxID=270547 RepID=A0AAD3MKF2_LATJO|nr:leukocyte elastase inhibitor-like protein [Lates japonicus]
MASSAPLSKANTTFCLDLFRKLSDDNKTANVFFSPFSISSALAMVMLGARGNTATQMSEVLGFNEPQPVVEPAEDQQQMQTRSPMQSQIQTRMQMQTQIQQSTRLPQYLLKVLKPQSHQEDDVHSGFTKLLSELNKEDAPYALSVANRLYGEQSFQFVESFLEETKKHYDAGLESVDFKSNSEEARVNINSWVEKQTQGKIKDLLSPEVLDSMTRLVLVNAIYFKGNWNKQFKEDYTVDAEFRINKNDTKPVKMMQQKSKFSLATIPDANCQIEGDTTGLEKLEKELTYEKFVEWTRPDLMGQTEVEVRLPRFKMEETYDLNEVLIGMGMVRCFHW